VRLIYADWLDEHDQLQRAEFIRVQCALTGEECPACKWREGFHEATCSLRRRERFLLDRNRHDWLCEALGMPTSTGSDETGKLGFRLDQEPGGNAAWVDDARFRRGFLS
jgi:hypothetical protein